MPLTARRLARCAAVVLVPALCTPASAAGQALTVVVTDPQDRTVPGAQVVVSCPSGDTELFTDDGGSVRLPERADPSLCEVSVSHPGFVPVSRDLEPGTWPRRIQLRVAPVHEQVEVAPAARTFPATSGAASAIIDAADLELIGSSTADWLRYARALAGTTAAGERIMVDGLPSTTLPPRNAIAQIVINLDPFSAEYASPDESQINIITRGPDASFHWGIAASALGAGGRNPLPTAAEPASQAYSARASGVVPFVGLGLLGQASWSRQVRPGPVRGVPVPNGAEQTDVVISRDRGHSARAMAFYDASDGTLWRGAYHHSASRVADAGAGGLTWPKAAVDLALSQREIRATLHGARSRVQYRGGFALSSTEFTTTGDGTGPALSVLGSFAAGSPAVIAEANRHRSATVKAVVTLDTARHPLDLGATLTHSRLHIEQQPNPFGTLLFTTLSEYTRALSGAATGLQFLQIGNGSVDTSLFEGSAFAQGYLVRRQDNIVRLGLRADFHTNDRVRVSPRVFALLARAGFIFSGGGGAFTRNWPAELFAKATLRDAEHLRELVIDGVALDGAPERSLESSPAIVSVIDPALQRRRDLVGRASVRRVVGTFDAQLEYTFTDGRHLIGSRRLPAPTGWTDQLQSRDRVRVHQFHAGVSYKIRDQRFTGHYEWVQSRDSSAGPFATEPDGHDTWAPSAGVPSWRASLVGALRLPGAISVSVIASAAGPTRYDVTSTLNTDGSYLFTERGVRARNSGMAAGTKNATVYIHRRLVVPRSITGLFPSHVNIGIELNNPFGWENYLTYGAVAGSPLLGQPLDAQPGRSLKFWITL